jgi:aminoglycoside/choline kinase family phosphotransferase
VAKLYGEALAMLATLRRDGTSRAGELETAGSALDEALFRKEMAFFREHFLVAHLGLEPGSAADREVSEALGRVAAQADVGPRVLCHRDFHARNLLVRGERLGLVDHQDARLGPDLYDLASLLRDPYVELEESFEEELLDAFAREADPGDAWTPGLRERFEAVALQRDLKAIGTYGYQATARGKRFYLEYVPRAVALARRAMARLPGAAALFSLFEDLGLFETGAA